MPGGDDAETKPPDQAAALSDAFAASREALVRTLSRRLGCRETAQDVAQDAIERALRSWGSGSIRHPRALLFRIALNLAVNQAIAQKRRERTLVQARDHLFAEMERPSPEQAVADREALEQLQAEFDRLPPQTRRILVLNRFEGLSQSQIADQLGISKTAVEKHMRRALARLSRLRHG